jgi:uncharacterized membrane protein
MRLWLIPMIYIVAGIACGLTLPRLEHHYFPTFTHDMSVATAQAFLSASGSGMLVLTGIMFSVAMVMVQFSAIAYSPREDVQYQCLRASDDDHYGPPQRWRRLSRCRSRSRSENVIRSL